MMTFRFAAAVFSLALLAHARAEDADALPDKVAALKHNYEAAVVRATSPITQKYVQELQRLKTEYTKAGNLEAALAADALLKEMTAAPPEAAAPGTPGSSASGRKLSKMTIAEFREWLATVSIVETERQKTAFQYDGTEFTSVRGPSATPRTHKVEIELGKIMVPFSTDLCVIRIAENLKTAVITYDDEAPVDARISPKGRP